MDSHDLVLDVVEQRILGSLMEKQRTVPASYPLTLNSLRTACNQTSSRDPVVDYDDALLTETLRGLKERGLVRIVWADRGPRTLKYHQTLDDRLALQPDERALVAVLLLRGPQAPGELRSRTDRLHAFADRGEVETVLRRLAALPTPLVREMERRPGQQDRRWVHLLGPVPLDEGPPEPTTGVDREVVLADGRQARDAKVVASYDVLAATYAERLVDELDHKPFDRWLLDRVAVLAGGGRVVDVGTGPGHVAAHLAHSGARVTGIDLSPEMVAQARQRFPDLRFEVGDLTNLLRPPDAPGWSAVTGWYSLVHLAPSELTSAVAALVRVLRPGGWLALALHTGAEVRHADELWEHTIDIDFVLHDATTVLDAVRAAGLNEVERYLRSPLADVEVETERLYVLARRPE